MIPNYLIFSSSAPLLFSLVSLRKNYYVEERTQILRTKLLPSIYFVDIGRDDK